MAKKEKGRAKQDTTPKPPVRYELGGGYYYTCYWLTCNEQLKRWWKFCPMCGTEIAWDDDYSE